MDTFFMGAAVVVGIIGCIAVFIMARPLMKKGAEKGEQMIIPLAEIAPVWIVHNKEIVPVKAGAAGVGEGAGDALDTLFAEAKNECKKENALTTAPAETAVKKEASTPAPWGDQNTKPAVPADQKQPEVPVSVAGPASPVSPVIPEASARPASPPTSVPPAVPATPSIPPAVPAPQTQNALNKDQLRQEFNALWKDCIEPYMKIITGTGADNVIQSLLRLLEEHGHCPSVVISNHDSESTDLITVRDNLTKITLRNHTYAVCRHMLAMVKDHYANLNAELMIPNALIISLGHDIGKIPELRLSGVYNSEDHAVVSGDKVAELMAENKIPWANRTIPIIKGHHNPTKDDLTMLLKKADQAARQAELITFSKNYNIKTFKQWFNVEKYLKEYIAPEVNGAVGKDWNAFSHKGTIYCKPEWLYRKAQVMCATECVLDLTFKYESMKDDATRMIVNAIREKNLTPLLAENQSSRAFQIKTSMGLTKGAKKYFLTAILIPEYIDQTAMESRKSGFTQIINGVMPA